MSETELLVKPNRRILGERVEERGCAFRDDVAHDLAHQDSGVASTACIRVGAHRADLHETRHAHSLPGHRQQAVAFEDSVIVPEFNGAFAKWPGFGQGRQLDHRRHIGNAKSSQLDARCKSTGFQQPRRATDHLRKQSAAKQAPARRRHRLIRKEQAKNSARTSQSSQRIIALRRLIRSPGKRPDGRKITPSGSLNQCVGVMFGAQRVPDRVVE